MSTSDSMKANEAQVEHVEHVAKKAKVDPVVAKKAQVKEEDQEGPFPFLFKKIKGSSQEEQKNCWSEIFKVSGWFYESSGDEALEEVTRSLGEIPGDELFPDQIGMILNWLSKAVNDGTVTLPPELQERLIESYGGQY